MANNTGIEHQTFNIFFAHRRDANRVKLMKGAAVVFTLFSTVIHDSPACWPSRQIISNSLRGFFQQRPTRYRGTQCIKDPD